MTYSEVFKPMCRYLSSCKGDRFEVEVFEVSVTEAAAMRLSSRFAGNSEYDGFTAGTYVRLVDNETCDLVMTDTAMEKKTNIDLYNKANGVVLIGGLGLGMVLLAIQDKPEVKKIYVIEKYQEVVDLVAHQLPLNEKVEIIVQDVHEYKIPKGMKYDVVYMDIWNDISGDNWEEYKKLNRKFSRLMNRENWHCWCNAWRKTDVQELATAKEDSYCRF